MNVKWENEIVLKCEKKIEKLADKKKWHFAKLEGLGKNDKIIQIKFWKLQLNLNICYGIFLIFVLLIFCKWVCCLTFIRMFILDNRHQLASHMHRARKYFREYKIWKL